MKHFHALLLALSLFVLWVSAPLLQAETVTYTIASKTSVTASGNVPEGSSAAYTQTYSEQCKMTSGHTTTLTLTGYTDCTITNIVLCMRSNKSAGSGTFSATAGGTSLAAIETAASFKEWYDNTAYTDGYKDVTVTLTNNGYTIQEGEKIVITIAATANSLYIQSYTLTYTYSASPITVTPASYVWTDLVKGVDATAQEFTVKATGLTDDITATLSDETHFTLSATSIPATGGTLSVTPVTTTTGTYTATLTLASGSVSKTVPLSATVVAPVILHTITYMSCGNEFAVQQEQEGKPLSFPATAPAVDGLVFYGWSAAEVSRTDVAPAVLSADAVVPEQDMVYYAVFTQADYIKITEEPSDWAGEYLIVYEGNNRVFNGALTTDLDGENNYRENSGIAGSKICATNTTDSITFTVARFENNYTLQSKSGYYIGRTASSNGISASLETKYPNTISYSAGAVYVCSATSGKTDYQLSYNTTTNRFRYYGPDTKSRKPVQFYAKSACYNYNTAGDTVRLVRGTETLSDLEAATTDLVVSNGATLTLEGTSSTVRSLTLQGGATVSVSGKLTLTTGLYLNAGWTTADGQTQYATPRLYLNDDGTISSTNDTVYLDFYINKDNYYPFAVPFATQVKDIRYADPELAAIAKYGYGADCQYCIMTYDGANRATGAVGDNWKTVGQDETLQPGVGYIIKAVQGKGDPYAVIRVPMKVDEGWLSNGEQTTLDGTTRNTVSVEAYGADDTDVADKHKGWNFIANPYLSDFDGTSLSGCSVNYVTVPVCNFAYYEQKQLSEAVLCPEWSFFVQTGTSGTLTFEKDGRQTVAPILRAGQTPPVIGADICLTAVQSGATDRTGLLIGEQYTPAYEIGADLEKMFGYAFTVAAYTLAGTTPLAYNALSMNDADTIALGFHAPQAGDYTLSLMPGEDIAGVERIDLIDYREGTVTDLLQNAYTFSVAEPCKDNTRFALHIAAAGQTPTDIVGTAGNADRAHKLLRNGRLCIIQGNSVYDVVGQRIQ